MINNVVQIAFISAKFHPIFLGDAPFLADDASYGQDIVS